MRERVRTVGFFWRELGPLETLRVILSQAACRLNGHHWERHTWFESWDVGAGYEEEWWVCRRCEAFSRTNPEPT